MKLVYTGDTGRAFTCGTETPLAQKVALTEADGLYGYETTLYTSDQSGQDGSTLIGVSMPTKNLERWSRDGENVKELLEEMGYTAELQYADNKVEQQTSQLQTMVNKNPRVLVVGSIDGSALGPVLETARNQDISVIAYDRLITGTEAVDYYVTFDNYNVGHLQGQYIVDALDLENAEGPF